MISSLYQNEKNQARHVQNVEKTAKILGSSVHACMRI